MAIIITNINLNKQFKLFLSQPPTTVSSKKYRFYGDYEPAPNVSKSLNNAEEDYNLVAPYRDMLGILESEQIWSEEEAITADEIRKKLVEWDENERERSEAPPKTTKTVRNQLNDLYQDYLVLKIEEPGRPNRYWKIPDGGISHPYSRKMARNVTQVIVPTLFRSRLLVG